MAHFFFSKSIASGIDEAVRVLSLFSCTFLNLLEILTYS